MFSDLDNIIFPDSCEVIQVPSQHFLYPIYKNGSTSLRTDQETCQWPTYRNSQIAEITDPIIVFIRDPKDRFISGVNTFLQHCHRDRPDLDQQTILWFVQNFLFLNRHYAPQFYWLINLARFSNNKLVFKGVESVSEYTNLYDRGIIKPPTVEFLKDIEQFPWSKLELYFFLDQLLYDRIGTTATFKEIVEDIKLNRTELYDLIFKRTVETVNALS